MQDSDAEKPSPLQLDGASSREEDLPVFCLLSSLFGESSTCSPNLSKSHPTPSDLQDTSTPMKNEDMTCITLSSTPVRKVSTPGDIQLDMDSGEEWSTSMATPTFVQIPIGSTPVITTTDEETSDQDRSLHATEGGPVTSRQTKEPVPRVLFRGRVQPAQSSAAEVPHSTGQINGLKKLHKGRFDLFSPIPASPLLSSHHQHQSPPSNEACQDPSVSLISTHTIVDTPTRLDRGKKRESVRLNKAFCDESGQQVACSQELFGSPEESTWRGEGSTLVNSVPDSPVLHTSPCTPPDRGDLTPAVLREPPDSHPEEATDVPTIIGTGEPVCEEQKVSTNQPTTVSPPVIDKDRSTTTCEPFLPAHKDSLSKKMCSTNPFMYPSSRRPSIRPCQTVRESCRDVKGVECSVQSLPRPPWLRSRRKRNASSSVAPPEKKILQSSIESTARDCSRLEMGTQSPDSVIQENRDLTSKENVTITAECSVVQPVAGVRESHDPGLSSEKGLSLSVPPHQQPAGPEHVPMECGCPSPPRPPPVAFTTASGHTLQISTHGMRRARELMAETEDEVPTPVSNREELASPAVVPLLDTNMSVVPPFTGFQTASGRSLSISEKALQKARRFLSEGGEDQHSSITTPLTTKTHQSVHTPLLPPTPQSVPTDRKTALRTPSCTLPPHSTLSTGRLRTRGGARQTKPFKAPRPANSVSKEEESAKITRLLDGMRRAGAGSDYVATHPPLETPSLAATSSVEFSTGSGKKLSISTASYQRAQQLVSEDKENGIATPDIDGVSLPPPRNWGFQSASGKRLGVSSHAMEKANTLFAGIDDENRSLAVPNEPAPEGNLLPGPSADHQCLYTGGELGQEDIAEFAAFTQVNFQDPGRQAPTDGSPLAPTSAVNSGRTKGEDTEREEMDQEGDDYFSTQVVKQFLNFSADEEDNEQPVDSPQIEPTSQGHPFTQQQCSPQREEGKVTNPLAGGSTTSSPANSCLRCDEVAKQTHTSFCQQATSASLIDELFGIVDSESCTADLPESGDPSTSQRGGVREGGSSGDVCSDTMSATMEEAVPYGEQPEADSSVTTAQVETAVEGAIADEHKRENSMEREGSRDLSGGDTTGTPVDISERATPPYSGLMTAGGRKITVSESALSAARATLYSSSPSPTSSHCTTDGDCLSAPIRAQLQTASGRAVGISEESLKAVQFILNTSSPSSPGSQQMTTSPRATDEVTTSQDVQKHKAPSSFPGLQTASGRPVHISEEALKAVRQADREGSPDLEEGKPSADGKRVFTASGSKVEIPQSPLASVSHSLRASCNSTADAGTSTDSHPSSVSGVASRTTPHFRPLATHKARPSSKPTVRYKPVFKSGHQTHPAPPPPSPALPTPSLEPVTRGLHSTPEGVLYDRAPLTSRRPLTPMQTYLSPDGTYVSTPVHRYQLRSLRSTGVAGTTVGRGGFRGNSGEEREVDSQRKEGGSGEGGGGCEGGGSVDQCEGRGGGDQCEGGCAEDIVNGGDQMEMKCVGGQMERGDKEDLVEGVEADSSSGASVTPLPVQSELERETVSKGDREMEERAAVRKDSMLDQLNDSLEGCDETVPVVPAEEKELHPQNKPLPVTEVSKHSRGQRVNSARRRRRMAPPSSAGSILSARLQWPDGRIPLSAITTSRLPGRYTDSELYKFGIPPSTVMVTAQNAAEFQFSGDLFFSSAVLSGGPVCVGDGAGLTVTEGRVGSKELWEAFAASPGVDRKLVSYQWFLNHYRWVVWKLAAMEVAFPVECGRHYLTPDWLMKQLRYRYDREIEAAERPALRKICERDDLSTRRLAVCVSAVFPGLLATDDDDGKRGQSNTSSVEVTDGWYSLPAILDPPLRYMLQSGRIKVGTKIITCGAELVGSPDPCHPLEAPPSLCLRLSANSTRRARWYTRLGYQPCPHPFPVPLSSLFPDGGIVGCTEAVIARVYPLIYMEKLADGKYIFRNARAEERASRHHQELRERKIEALSTKIQQQFEEEVTRQERSCTWRRSRRLNALQVKQLKDGEAIHLALANSPDPQAVQEVLSPMQLALLESYRQCLVDSRQSEMQQRMEKAVRREEREGRLPGNRTTTPLLRALLVPPGSGHTPLDCHLSVWQPRDDVLGVLVEGKLVRMWSVNTSFKRSKGLQLSASRCTRFQCVDMDSATLDTALGGYKPRECVSIGRLGREGSGWVRYGEVDTVGLVVCVTTEHVEGADMSGHQIAIVYLADGEGNMMAVKVWQGLEAPSESHMREGLRQLKESLPSNKNYLHSLEEKVINTHLP